MPPFLGDGGKVCDGKDGTGSGSGTTGPAASGTSLTATAPAASGFFNRALEYDWTIHQAVDPASIQIDKGQSVSVTYIIDTTRTAVSEDDVYGVRGQACVTNSGSRPTENLTIVNAVQVKVGSGSFSDYVQKAVDTSTKPQLNAGESYCYPYETTFPVVAASAQYKSQARVTITNHSGSIGTAKGPSPSTGFSIPATPTITERDATAEVVADASACVAGMSCTTAGNDGVFNFSDTGSVLYSKELVDDNAACASAFIMPGSATLTESDSRASLGTSADISVTTAECATVITGCTLTQGYWKNHGSEWPLQKMSLGSVEYTKTQLLSIMRKSVKGNGLIALSYQLIAAKLNVAAGASAPASVSNSIAAADALIGNLVVPPVGTATMDTSKTSGLTEVLDQYNNGLAEGGPAHCQ